MFKIVDDFYNNKWFIKSIMEHIDISVIVTDLNFKIIYVNNATEKLYGYSKKELIGSDPSIVNVELNANEIQKSIYETVGRGEVWHGSIKNKKKNKEMILIDLTISPFRNKEDEVVAYIGFIKNITEQKTAGEQLFKIAEELKKSNEELEQFAYIASHDLQEPLRAVSAYCQLLKENNYECIDEEGQKYLDYAVDSSLRMKTLIKELLDYSRVGRKDKPFEQIDLKNLLQETLNDFEVTIKETGVEVIIESDLPEIYGIRFRIKQLLHNLISNSIKFRGKENPEIRIGCCGESTSDHWLFYVKDNGIGIDPEYYDRIFGVFKRLYSRDEYPGTGIGLALCKRIVETHGGNIWVDSIKNGTYMYFTISKAVNI